MGHSKLSTITKTPNSPQDNENTSANLQSVKKTVFHFYPKPVYFDRTLIHVDFSPIKDTVEEKSPESTHDVQSTSKYTILLIFVFAILFAYMQSTPVLITDPRVNHYVVASLIQLGNDPSASAAIIRVFDYTLL